MDLDTADRFDTLIHNLESGLIVLLTFIESLEEQPPRLDQKIRALYVACDYLSSQTAELGEAVKSTIRN